MKKIEGACHCGKNTFSIEAEPQFQFVCYCSGCRVLNSAGHLCGIVFYDENLSKATETKVYTYEGGNAPINLHFCPDCATHLYAFPTAMPGKVAVRPSVLKDFDFKSQQAIFTETAFEWDKPVDG